MKLFGDSSYKNKNPTSQIPLKDWSYDLDTLLAYNLLSNQIPRNTNQHQSNYIDAVQLSLFTRIVTPTLVTMIVTKGKPALVPTASLHEQNICLLLKISKDLYTINSFTHCMNKIYIYF